MNPMNGNVAEPMDLARAVKELSVVVNNALQEIM
ncbi:hypothetical protein A2U01_0109995, partial [Trifolium medium]|nr:hypothetical protein [Trifolium medium]